MRCTGPAIPRHMAEQEDILSDLGEREKDLQSGLPGFLRMFRIPSMLWRHVTLNQPRSTRAVIAGVTISVSAFGTREPPRPGQSATDPVPVSATAPAPEQVFAFTAGVQSAVSTTGHALWLRSMCTEISHLRTGKMCGAAVWNFALPSNCRRAWCSGRAGRVWRQHQRACQEQAGLPGRRASQQRPAETLSCWRTGRAAGHRSCSTWQPPGASAAGPADREAHRPAAVGRRRHGGHPPSGLPSARHGQRRAAATAAEHRPGEHGQHPRPGPCARGVSVRQRGARRSAQRRQQPHGSPQASGRSREAGQQAARGSGQLDVGQGQVSWCAAVLVAYSHPCQRQLQWSTALCLPVLWFPFWRGSEAQR